MEILVNMRFEALASAMLTTQVVFPTLIGTAWCPDAPVLNCELLHYIRAREQSDLDQSRFTTVNRGWQSGLDFLDVPEPAVQRLKTFINEELERFLAELGRATFGPQPPASFHYRYTGWAVVLQQGGFQHEHVHTKTDVTGVYYVAAPDVAAGLPPGDIVFTDPRPGRLASRSIWEAAHFHVRPEAGMLLFFPSFLPHRVDQIHAPGERISINFDVTVEPNHAT